MTILSTTSTIDRFDGTEYEFLSNFYPSKIVDEMGVVYPTVEHAFQAAKSLNIADRSAIALAGTPGKSKRMGRAVKLRPDWEKIREEVMLDCLRQKFEDPELRTRLLATGEARLIEGNTWGDTFWGVDTKKGGLNMLGKTLEKIRSSIRELRTE